MQTLKCDLKQHFESISQGSTVPNFSQKCLDTFCIIEDCANNMRNTNSFMLMTINRCIDYTKASIGLKLLPKFETVNLFEVIQLPLNCMRNIQERVEVILNPLPTGLCSHIITDKQWLQENLLCLLSNAVKFTTEGDVTISVTFKVDDDHINSSNLDDTQQLLYFEIQDSGIGIPEDAVNRLFRPFR